MTQVFSSALGVITNSNIIKQYIQISNIERNPKPQVESMEICMISFQ